MPKQESWTVFEAGPRISIDPRLRVVSGYNGPKDIGAVASNGKWLTLALEAAPLVARTLELVRAFVEVIKIFYTWDPNTEENGPYVCVEVVFVMPNALGKINALCRVPCHTGYRDSIDSERICARLVGGIQISIVQAMAEAEKEARRKACSMGHLLSHFQKYLGGDRSVVFYRGPHTAENQRVLQLLAEANVEVREVSQDRPEFVVSIVAGGITYSDLGEISSYIKYGTV